MEAGNWVQMGNEAAGVGLRGRERLESKPRYWRNVCPVGRNVHRPCGIKNDAVAASVKNCTDIDCNGQR